MFKKGIFMVIGVVVLLTPTSFIYADTIQEIDSIQMKLTLGSSLVDKPIEELKKENIVIERNRDGRYVVIIVDKNGNETKQVVSEKDAIELGYVEDIVNNLPKDSEIIIEKDDDGRYIVTIIGENGSEIRQYITEEALALGYGVDINDLLEGQEVVSIEKRDGDFVAFIKDESGKVFNQKISEEDAQNTGVPLPATATSMYNYLLIGVGLLIGGLVLLVVKRRSKRKSLSS